MGSATSTIQEAVDHLNALGERTGLVKVRLFRPWDAEAFRAAVPETARDVTVLDRTREDGAVGQPLFLDTAASFALHGEQRKVVGGQYGLASKEFTPKHVVAAFDNMRAAQPKHNFVLGIRDDVTHTSLEVGPEVDTIPQGTKQCLFWGLGTDGTVGANKAAIKTISSNTSLFGQGHFMVSGPPGPATTYQAFQPQFSGQCAQAHRHRYRHPRRSHRHRHRHRHRDRHCHRHPCHRHPCHRHPCHHHRGRHRHQHRHRRPSLPPLSQPPSPSPPSLPVEDREEEDPRAHSRAGTRLAWNPSPGRAMTESS